MAQEDVEMMGKCVCEGNEEACAYHGRDGDDNDGGGPPGPPGPPPDDDKDDGASSGNGIPACVSASPCFVEPTENEQHPECSWFEALFECEEGPPLCQDSVSCLRSGGERCSGGEHGAA